MQFMVLRDLLWVCLLVQLPVRLNKRSVSCKKLAPFSGAGGIPCLLSGDLVRVQVWTTRGLHTVRKVGSSSEDCISF